MLLPVRQIWDIFDPVTRRQAVILCVLISIASLMEAVGVTAMFPLLKMVSTPERMAEVPVLMAAHAAVGSPSPRDFTIMLALGALAIFLLKNAFALVVSGYQFRFVWDNRSRLSLKLYRHYLASDYEFHLRRSSARLQRNVSLSMDEIFGCVVLPAVQIASEVVVVIAILAVLLTIDPWPTMGVMVLFGVVTIGFHAAVRNRVRMWGAEHEATNAEILSTVGQALRIIKAIKVARREGYFADVLSNVLTRNGSARRRHQFATSLPRLMLESLAISVMLLSVVVLLLLGRNPGDVIVTLGLFGVVAFRLMPSLNRLAGYASNLRVGSSMAATIHADIMAIRTLPQARVNLAEEQDEPLLFNRALRFENVVYHYPETVQPALRSVTMEIPAGRSVALVGPSGAGKTTLADMLLGLLEPQQGDILADGVSIRGHTRQWQRNVGYVPQEVVLLDGTIRSNVALGVAFAEIDEERLRRAVRLAQLEPLVASLPDGLDTMVGEGINALSGGQRQRIGIARALYGEPRILIMDEATSALDADTEDLITRAIESLRGDTTLVIVAHRLSTVKRCDVLYYMREGAIEDCGSFKELTVRHPDFAKAVKLMGLEDGTLQRP